MLSMAPASAATVKHRVIVSNFDTHWECPGRDVIEHVTTTVHRTEFRVDGVRVRSIEHTLWKGHIVNRRTGASMRDEGSWTTVATYAPNGRRVLRLATNGSVWRFTVPGEGIVVHQTGRTVVGDQDFESAFGGFADSSLMCPFV
jgi:hypothetical protein